MNKVPADCIMRKVLRWKIAGGKENGAFATTHRKCASPESQCESLEECLRETFKAQTGKSESDYSQMNIYINLKSKAELEQTPAQEQENIISKETQEPTIEEA
jgi:hypothetical protein